MISEFSVSPKPQNNVAKLLMLTMFFLTAIIFVTSSIIEKYRGVVSSFGLITLTAALLIYTKYISVKYYYEIMIDDDDTPLFLVRQTVGKRTSTLCRVELATVIRVEREDKAKCSAHKIPKGTYLYRYLPTMAPSYVIRLYISGYSAKSEILIEGNEDFSNLLSDYAKIARERYRASED